MLTCSRVYFTLTGAEELKVIIAGWETATLYDITFAKDRFYLGDKETSASSFWTPFHKWKVVRLSRGPQVQRPKYGGATGLAAAGAACEEKMP
jgi:hypothetical protein